MSAPHDAVQQLRTVLAQRPDATEALSQLVDIHVARSEWDEALAACDRTLLQHPEHVGAKYKKSFVLALQGELDVAERLMQEVAAAVPTYAPAFSNLAALATWQNDMPRA